jgi:hypothetical protein
MGAMQRLVLLLLFAAPFGMALGPLSGCSDPCEELVEVCQRCTDATIRESCERDANGTVESVCSGRKSIYESDCPFVPNAGQSSSPSAGPSSVASAASSGAGGSAASGGAGGSGGSGGLGGSGGAAGAGG